MQLEGRTVGEIVADDYRLGAVFKRFGIDFCCGGGQSVEVACRKRGVDVGELREALSVAAGGRGEVFAPDVRRWTPGFLADFIVNVHHSYVRESLPVLVAFSDKVARVHGHAQPELYEIAETVTELAREMTAHLASEEEEVFPKIKQTETDPGAIPQEALASLYEEHDHAGGLMARLRTLTSDFVPPEWACNTYRALFAKLEEFEEDLHRHVHLENNVLFPGLRAKVAIG